MTLVFAGESSLCVRTEKSSALQICLYMLFFSPPRWSTATQCGYRVSEPLARHTGGQRGVGSEERGEGGLVGAQGGEEGKGGGGGEQVHILPRAPGHYRLGAL